MKRTTLFALIVVLALGLFLGSAAAFGQATASSSTKEPQWIVSGYTRPLIVPTSAPTDYTAFLPTTLGLTTGETQAAILLCLQGGTCRQVGYDTLRGFGYFPARSPRCQEYPLEGTLQPPALFPGL